MLYKFVQNGREAGQRQEERRVGEKWAGRQVLHHEATEVTVNPERTKKFESDMLCERICNIVLLLKSALWSVALLPGRADTLPGPRSAGQPEGRVLPLPGRVSEPTAALCGRSLDHTLHSLGETPGSLPERFSTSATGYFAKVMETTASQKLVSVWCLNSAGGLDKQSSSCRSPDLLSDPTTNGQEHIPASPQW